MEFKSEIEQEMSQSIFSHNEDPLEKNCECYACKNFNKAYIYHLLDVKEINAFILLAMHNLF